MPLALAPDYNTNIKWLKGRALSEVFLQSMEHDSMCFFFFFFFQPLVEYVPAQVGRYLGNYERMETCNRYQCFGTWVDVA